MADAGGGSGWDAFEIALIVLLAAGILMRLTTGKALFEESAPSTSSQTTTISAPTPQDTCGLSVVSPRPLEKVHAFVTVTGATMSCQWPSTQTVALYAQVVDGKGVPVSAYTTIPPTDVQGETTTFNTTVVLTTVPKTKSGYLILIPAKATGPQTVTARIPLTFVK